MARSPIKPAAFALGAALALSACANVEIDVDVYKGPLANHQDMQIQQLAAMTVAARPLLVGLRDELAMADIHRMLDPLQFDQRRTKWRTDGPEKYYEELCRYISHDSWIRRFTDGECVKLVRDRAERVNAIIGLYEPRGGRFDGTLESLAEIRRSYLERVDAEKDAALKNQTRWPDIAMNLATNADPRRVTNLRQFLTAGPDSNVGDFVRALGKSEQSESSNQAAMYLTGKDDWKRDIAGLFSVLARPGVRDKVLDVVHDKASDYLEARRLLAEGLDRSLDLLIDPDSLLRARGIRDMNAPETPGKRQLYRRQIATFIGTLIQGEHLILALEKNTAPELSGLRSAVGARAIDILSCSGSTNRSVEIVRSAGVTVGKWLADTAHDDAELKRRVEILRRLDAFLRGQKSAGVVCAPNTLADWRLGQSDRFKFGLARGPSLSSEALAAEMAWAAALGEAGLGLADGRHDKGLIERIEAFLKIRDGAQPTARASVAGLSPEAWPLLDAIGDFATKVAFLADNDSVFAARTAGTNANVTRYIAALQAVANQLTVQVDEIRRRESHRERFPGPADRQAAAQVLAVSPERVIAGLLSNLDGLSPAQSLELRTVEATLTELKLSPSLTVIAATAAKTAATSPAAEKKTGHENLKALDERLARLTAEIATGKIFDRVLTGVVDDSSLTASPTFSVFADAVVARAKRPALPSVPLTPEAAATADAIEKFLADLKADDAFKTGSKPRAEWSKAIRDRLPIAAAAVKSLLPVAATEAGEAQAKLVSATMAEASAKRAAELREELRAKNAAYAFVNPQRTALIQVYADAQAKTPPVDAWATFKADLRGRAGRGTTAERDAWKRAADVADAMNPPSARDVDAALAALPTGATALDTLDALIQNLRFELVETTRRLGADSPQVKSIQAAIDTAYDQRSGMAYIRPPAAFLRMVNAASAIQPDPGLGAQNRLQRSFWRSVPLIGSSLANLGEEENLRVRADIDRQNWQNINRVRLDGAGRTNYALVKDDIGNWYAKGYEADTTKIVESMRGLAMFNIGPRLPGLSPASLPRAPAGQAPAPGPTVADQSQMGRALTQFREAHAKEIDTIYENVRKLSDSIVADAKGAVDSGIKLDTGRNESLKTQFEGFWRGVTSLNETPLVPKDQDRATFLRKIVSDRLSDLLVFRTRAIVSARNAATVATTTAPSAATPPAPGAPAAPAAPVETKYSKPEDAAKAISDALSKKIADELSRFLAAIEKFEKEAYVLSAATKE